jgi:hypothetical protein
VFLRREMLAVTWHSTRLIFLVSKANYLEAGKDTDAHEHRGHLLSRTGHQDSACAKLTGSGGVNAGVPGTMHRPTRKMS